MPLILFDLDNTLIAGDSDYLWGEFMAEQGLVDSASYRARNDEFFRAYQCGKLDIQAYQRFALAPLSQFTLQRLTELHRQFLREKIEPLRLRKAEAVIAGHKANQDVVAIITSTNRFITEPIARMLGIEHLLATELELADHRYTGHISGVPCYQTGKITHLENWLAEHPQDMTDSYFYSDSINDLPLLELVDNPVAVDPDPLLDSHARQANWPVVYWRGDD